MSRLTRSEIETMFDDLILAHPIYTPQLRALREQSLSQEAVRDEALGYCWLIECNDGTEGGPHYWSGNVSSLGSWTKDAFKAIRFQRKIDAENIAVNHSSSAWKAVCHHFDDALKREPLADDDEPAPAAPVAEVAKRLRSWAYAHPGNVPEDGSLLMEEAAALLAKLGQGWVPVSEGRPQNSRPVLIQWYDGDSDGMLVAQYNGIRWTYDGGIVPPSTEVTHWMPLPKSPGASDD